jgi:hypothetical protein
MKRLLTAIFLFLFLAASSAQAEYRHVQMTVFGMD